LEAQVRGYDIDGVLTAGIRPEGPFVIISGRTFAEYDGVAMAAAQQGPLYIRGVGAYGDRRHAGEFKADMIAMLGVTEFHEDDPLQAEIIAQRNPGCTIVIHGTKGYTA
jgi:hypothetical protein